MLKSGLRFVDLPLAMVVGCRNKISMDKNREKYFHLFLSIDILFLSIDVLLPQPATHATTAS